MKNIIFSGAGFKCWAYIGTLRALQEQPFQGIEQIIGVSAGAIFGLFYVLDIPWEFILDFFMNINFKEAMDIDIDNVLIQQSVLAGKKFTGYIKEIISYFVDPDITFKDLHLRSKLLFTVNALNITESFLEYFNYKLTPDIRVIDAVRASSSLPIILPAYPIGDSFYYDGGICNNCPLTLVDEVDTIAFSVGSFKSKNDNKIKLLDLLNALVIISNKLNRPCEDNLYKILDDKFKNEMYNLNQSRDDIFNIYMNGYTNSKEILFKNYIALPSN